MKLNADQWQLEQNVAKGKVSPAAIATDENFLAPDAANQTRIHTAAAGGHLAIIPQHLFTRNNFTQPNDIGDTPLHLAAWSGHLDQVPKNLLATPRDILTANQKGVTPLEVAALHGQLEQIPITADLAAHYQTQIKPTLDKATERLQRGMPNIPQAIATKRLQKVREWQTHAAEKFVGISRSTQKSLA